MRVRYSGELPLGLTPKDVILGTIGRIGVDGAVGHVLEYAGEPIERFSMEGRLTICNMSIEAGARAGMIAPDDTTFAYLEGRPAAPKGGEWEAALDRWRTLRTDDDACSDRGSRSTSPGAGDVGTNAMVAPVGAAVRPPRSRPPERDAASGPTPSWASSGTATGHPGRPRVHHRTNGSGPARGGNRRAKDGVADASARWSSRIGGVKRREEEMTDLRRGQANGARWLLGASAWARTSRPGGARFDLEPLQGMPGQRRPDAPDEPCRGGCAIAGHIGVRD